MEKLDYKKYHKIMQEKINPKITFAECSEIMDNVVQKNSQLLIDEDFLYEFGTYYESHNKDTLICDIEQYIEDYDIDVILRKCKTLDLNKKLSDYIVEYHREIVNLSTGNYFYLYGERK